MSITATEFTQYKQDVKSVETRRKNISQRFRDMIKNNDGNVAWKVSVTDVNNYLNRTYTYYFRTYETAEKFVNYCKNDYSEKKNDIEIDLDVSVANRLTDDELYTTICSLLEEFDSDIAEQIFFTKYNDWVQ